MQYEPRPPSSRSARSASSRARLAERHELQQLQTTILKDMQVAGQRSGRHMAPSAFKHMATVAGEEAARVLGVGGLAEPATPNELLARVEQARQVQLQAVTQLSPVVSPAGDLPAEPASKLLVGDRTPGSPMQPGREVRIDVAGKGIPLTTMIVDKVGQRGGQQRPGGEANQLRKAFKTVDGDKDGKVTMAELQEILSTVHISISEESLKRQFLQWTGGKPLLEWNPFIQKILPRDFPTQFDIKSSKVHDIASIARHDCKTNDPRHMGLITNVRDWEVAFRDKIMAKTRGGPLELRKAWIKFDVDRSGTVTIDDILKKCARWNLYPTDEVKKLLVQKYCAPENQSTGEVRFYDFIKGVVALDFKSSRVTLLLMKRRLESHWSHVTDQFRATDTNRSGDITLDELDAMLYNLHIPSSKATTAAIFRLMDKDHSQTITLEEFAKALETLDNEEINIPGVGGKLLWEQQREDPMRQTVRRPNTAGSIHSHDGDKDQAQLKSGHVVVDVDMEGKFVVNTAVTYFNAQQRPGATAEAGKADGGYDIDLIQLVRDKIYQKYGEKGMYSWLRRACMKGVGAADRYKKLDTMKWHLDGDPGSSTQNSQYLSLNQWRGMLKDLGLQLTDAAFAACVHTLSPDGTDLVPFVRFTDLMAGKAESHALGLPSERASNGRLVPEPPLPNFQPRSLSPYGVLSHDPIALVRYKIGQLTATRYAANPRTVGARRRLRDQFSTLDPTLSGQCTRDEFLSVLSYYNINLKNSDWDAFAAKYAGTIVRADGMIDYKKFQSKVLDPNAADAGFYTPRAGGRLRRQPSPRTVRNLRTPTIKLGQDIPMAKTGWQTTR